jgi:hypothetical protein
MVTPSQPDIDVEPPSSQSKIGFSAGVGGASFTNRAFINKLPVGFTPLPPFPSSQLECLNSVVFNFY